MLDKNLPISQPGKVKGFGHPWHGLVKAGILTAAVDGATRSYTQPSRGDTNLVRIPGANGGIGLTAAAGQEWTDYAILAGEQRQLYEVALGPGAWIYADPANKPWLVTLQEEGASVGITVGLTVNATLKRFGVIGAAPVTHTIAASVSDLQQGGSPWEVVGSNGIQAITSAELKATSTTTIGDRAILTLRGSYDEGVLNPVQLSIGFAQLELSGTPGTDLTATLTVLRSRAQTLGTYVEPVGIPTTRYKLDPDEYDDVDVIEGGPPSCTGTRTRTSTKKPTTYTAAVPEETLLRQVHVGSGSESYGTTGRIINLAFSTSGTVHEWTIDNTQDNTLSLPFPTDTSSGTLVCVWDFTGPNGSGGCNEDSTPDCVNTLSEGYTRISQAVWTVDYTLRLDGAIISSVSITGQEDTIGTSGNSSSDGSSKEWNATYTVSVTAAGGTNHSFTAFQSRGYFPFNNEVPPGLLGSSHQDGNNGVSFDAELFIIDVAYADGQFEQVNAIPMYYSNNLIGLQVSQNYQQAGNSEYASGAGAPGNIDTSNVPLVGVLNPNGSWNPVTGQVTFGEADAVCYV